MADHESNVGGLVLHNPYGVQRRRKGRSSDIHDPEFRSQVISFAACGTSRRGVAALCGKPESTIRGWIERGRAYPDVEPWASFAEQYERAERRLEMNGAGTIAIVMDQLYGLAKNAQQGDRWSAEQLMKNPQLKEILNVLGARFPKDWGTSKHREPEQDYDPSNYLDSTGMDREQLGALLCDPPDVLRLAMVDQAHEVYGILIAAGFDPTAPRKAKANDESDNG